MGRKKEKGGESERKRREGEIKGKKQAKKIIWLSIEGEKYGDRKFFLAFVLWFHSEPHWVSMSFSKQRFFSLLFPCLIPLPRYQSTWLPRMVWPGSDLRAAQHVRLCSVLLPTSPAPPVRVLWRKMVKSGGVKENYLIKCWKKTEREREKERKSENENCLEVVVVRKKKGRKEEGRSGF